MVSITGTHTVKNASGTTLTSATTRTLGPEPIYLTGTVTVAPAAGQEVLLAYPEIDFALNQTTNGWTYRSLSGSTYTNATVDDPANDWMLTGNAFWQLGPTTAHPAVVGGVPVAAVRRWTVPSGITRVRVAGTWARGPGGDGSGVTLLHDSAVNTIRFQRAALLGTPGATATVTMDQVFDVVPGDVLEFRVDPGPGTDITGDSTVLRALIYSTTAAETAPDVVAADPLALVYPYTSTTNITVTSETALESAVNSPVAGRHVKVGYNHTAATTITLSGDGTAAQPIVIRPDGALLSRTISNAAIDITGSYIVLAGFNLTNTRVTLRGHHNRLTRCKTLVKDQNCRSQHRW